MKLSFLSLASGSSGNCYYLGTPEFGVLIDAGIGIRTIKKVLKDKAIDFSKIVAVLITHDHACNNFGDHKFTLATDVGHITKTVSKYMGMANHLIIEANYDEEMLQFGTYPAFLKERVASPTGHLSNREAAEFLATHYDPKLKDIWLCHLSRDNNHPELAYKTVDFRLFQEGVRVGKDVSLHALKRTTPSDIFEFD